MDDLYYTPEDQMAQKYLPTKWTEEELALLDGLTRTLDLENRAATLRFCLVRVANTHGHLDYARRKAQRSRVDHPPRRRRPA